jgi:transforming growth factor-beta-induced protein
MKLLSKFLLLAVLLTAGVSCSDDDDATPPQTTPNLVEAAQAAGLTTLLDAVGAVEGLDQTLLNADAITVFAPTNDAFADALDAFNVNDLNGLVEAIGGVDNLEIVLGFHVVPAVAFSTDLAEGEQTFNTLAGQEITVTRTGSEVTVTDANGTVRNVITPDVEIENGVVHVIDGVLLPTLPEPEPTIAELAAGNDDLTSLVAALEYTGLDAVVADPDADLTVFAPTNSAFATFLDGAELTDLPVAVVEQVLLNHVLSGTILSTDLETSYTNSLATYADTENNLSFYINVGEDVVINGISTVRGPDNEASNGVVHVVDAVIELPTVVTFATADPNFSSLVSALTDPGQSDQNYVATLSTQGEAPAPFTVFAPTNQAFTDLLAELEVNGLGDIDPATLTAALNTHVVAEANVRQADLMDGTVNTLGADVTVDAAAGTLTDPNGRVSTIAVFDVQAANGVVHAIDTVLLPQL